MLSSLQLVLVPLHGRQLLVYFSISFPCFGSHSKLVLQPRILSLNSDLFPYKLIYYLLRNLLFPNPDHASTLVLNL